MITDRQAGREGICLLAGPAAQRRFNPRSVRSYHARNDHEQVVTWALAVGGSNEVINARVKLWNAQARELIEGRWPLVEKVAAALIERRTLTEAGVTALNLVTQHQRYAVTPLDGRLRTASPAAPWQGHRFLFALPAECCAIMAR